jgi:lipid-A-disaccharide synthase
MSGDPSRPLSLLLVAGEPSGDQLGAQLMAGIRSASDDQVKIEGVGGPAMEAQGLRSLFPLSDTAVMGLREVVPKIPVILRRVREISDYALKHGPDAVVLIDSPDFTHRIARRLKSIDPAIRTVNYVPPQVWASRAYRARAMARYFDIALALLPFEPPFFERFGLRCEFVGHPVLERKAKLRGGAALRNRLGITPDTPLLAVLPGSRSSEIHFILPVFKLALEVLAQRLPRLVTVLPTLPHLAARVRQTTQGWPTPLHILEDENDKYAAFDAANAALAASGTVTTELALARTPMVAAYRVGGLTYLLAKPLFRLPHFTLINLLLDKPAVPEFLQHHATPNALADAVAPLLIDTAAAARQIADLDEAAKRLGAGADAPSLRAAKALIDFAQAKKNG